MMPVPEAVKESMEAYRRERDMPRRLGGFTENRWRFAWLRRMAKHRKHTRAIVAALRALRRQEEAGILGLGR